MDRMLNKLTRTRLEPCSLRSARTPPIAAPPTPAQKSAEAVLAEVERMLVFELEDPPLDVHARDFLVALLERVTRR
jgi:hypothetical protein